MAHVSVVPDDSDDISVSLRVDLRSGKISLRLHVEDHEDSASLLLEESMFSVLKKALDEATEQASRLVEIRSRQEPPSE